MITHGLTGDKVIGRSGVERAVRTVGDVGDRARWGGRAHFLTGCAKRNLLLQYNTRGRGWVVGSTRLARARSRLARKHVPTCTLFLPRAAGSVRAGGGYVALWWQPARIVCMSNAFVFGTRHHANDLSVLRELIDRLAGANLLYIISGQTRV